MPWCQNPMCNKQNLRKEDVEFDEVRQAVLCLPCFQEANPGSQPNAPIIPIREEAPLFYEIAINNREGLRAELRFRDVSLQFRAAPEELKTFAKSLGPRPRRVFAV